MIKHSAFSDQRPARPSKADSRKPTAALAFTLTEMMIAIALLLVVIIATSQIFGTASKVTGIGQATQAVITEAAVIEQQLRADIANLNREGFIAIRCTAVRNNVNVAAGGALLNPNLPDNALIRSDQLLFFINRLEAMQSLRLSAGGSAEAQGTASRMYYGHAFQLPLGPAYVPTNQSQGRAIDAATNLAMKPWTRGNAAGQIATVQTLFSTIGAAGGGSADTIFGVTGAGPNISTAQPQASQWLLARQGAVLADDSELASNTNSKTVALGETLMGRSIFFYPVSAPGLYGHSRELRNGRVDGAASLMNEIRRTITINGLIPAITPPLMRNWRSNPQAAADQRTIIANNALYYPRAERKAPSMHRVDQALTNHVISGGCSSFIVDWTYADGTGAVLDAQGNVVDPTPALPNSGDELLGVGIPPGTEQPWFGMPNLNNFPANVGYPDPQRGTMPYFNWPGVNQAATFFPYHIDDVPVETPAGSGVYVYEAFFGYNQSEPRDATGALWPLVSPKSYTPWPTALRITMTLHDPEGRLENGREVQFVIDLPRQK